MLSGNFFPMYDDYDDKFFGKPFHSRRYADSLSRRRRQLAFEEAQRQAQMERYNRWKEHQELLKRQEEAEREKERRRRQQMYQKQFKRRNPAHRIVRGHDGRLYRVPVETDNNNEQVPEIRTVLSEKQNGPKTRHKTKPKENEQVPLYVRGPGGRIYKVTNRNSPSPGDLSDRDDEARDLNDEEMVMDEPKENTKEVVDKSPVLAPKTTKKNPRRRVTVVIEDASDSEDDDELKSYWRNRHPSAGESWMEPIKM